MNSACEVPLVEQLRSVPADAMLNIDTPNALGCVDTRHIPIGALCHQAAAALETGGSGVPARPTSPGELHAAIINLPCKHGDWSGENGNMAYKLGHRDARHAAAELALGASPLPQEGRTPLTDAAIRAMVNRFLGWKLPKTFGPDCYISFDRTQVDYERPGFWPTGTNLFTSDEARAMFEYVLAAIQEPQ